MNNQKRKNEAVNDGTQKEKNSGLEGLVLMIRKKLKETTGKVRDAPQLFRKRIYLVLFIVVFCFVLMILTLALSLIPSMSYLRAVSAIAAITAIYMGMSLPRWLRVIDNHIVFVGKVKEIKTRKITDSAKRAIMNSNNRSMLILTVEVKGKEIKIEVPQTSFSPVVERNTYRFYYATDEEDQSNCSSCAWPLSLSNFLFKEWIDGIKLTAYMKEPDASLKSKTSWKNRLRRKRRKIKEEKGENIVDFSNLKQGIAKCEQDNGH